MVKGEGVLGPREDYLLDLLLENCLVFVTRCNCTLLPTSTSTQVQVGNNFQLSAKPLISPTMSYHCVCLHTVAGDTPTLNVMEIGAFSLCVIFTKAPSGPPWDKRALALSSSQDQCA